MSKNINFKQPLDEADEAYVRQRPWLIRDAELDGTVVRFASTEVEEEDEPEETGETDTHTNIVPAEEEEEEVDYNDLNVADLKAEIAARNEGREDDSKISSAGKKEDLVAALEADDESAEETEE